MEIFETALPEVKHIRLTHFGDARGFFVERFHAARFAEHGLPSAFVQDNHSRSAPGILRGIHYQHTPAQGKLVGVIRGKVWDVAVDLRTDSPNFGQHVAVALDGDQMTHTDLLWIPAGFGHGFCVIGNEPADMLYKTTAHYNAAGEGGVRWDDATLDIPWPIKAPEVSKRDDAQPTLQEYASCAPAWKEGV